MYHNLIYHNLMNHNLANASQLDVSQFNVSRVGRFCACLESNSYAKRGQNLPKKAKLQFS